jgi:hypothetical protein
MRECISSCASHPTQGTYAPGLLVRHRQCVCIMEYLESPVTRNQYIIARDPMGGIAPLRGHADAESSICT